MARKLTPKQERDALRRATLPQNQQRVTEALKRAAKSKAPQAETNKETPADVKAAADLAKEQLDLKLAAKAETDAAIAMAAAEETARVAAEAALAAAQKEAAHVRASAAADRVAAEAAVLHAQQLMDSARDSEIAAVALRLESQKIMDEARKTGVKPAAEAAAKKPTQATDSYFDTGADSLHTPAEYAAAWEKKLAAITTPEAKTTPSAAPLPNGQQPFFATTMGSLPISSVNVTFGTVAGTTPQAASQAPAAQPAGPRIRFVPTVPVQPRAQATPPAGAAPVTPPPAMTPPPANLLNADEFTPEQLRILDIFEQVVGDPQHGYNTLYRQHKDHRNVHAGRDFKVAARPNPHFPTDPSKALPEMTVLTVTPKGIEVHDHSMQAMASAIELSIKMYNGNFQAQNVSLEQENKILTFVLEGLKDGSLTDGNSNILEEVTFNNVTYTKAQAETMLAARAAGVAPPPPPPAAPSFARGPAAGSRPAPPSGRTAATPTTASRPAATGTNGGGLNAGPRPINRFVPRPKAP